MNEISLRPARETRTIAEELTLDQAREHITLAAGAIEQALYEGQFEAQINLRGQMHPAAIRRLRKAGYDLHRSGLNGYTISWRF